MSTSDEIQTMLDDCEARESKLSDWEASFVDSVSRHFAQCSSITEKQDETLSKIWERVTG